MSSKLKQVLLWVTIISTALLFVYFLNSKQTKNPQELSYDIASTRIENKEVSEVLFKQDSVELTVSKTASRTARKSFLEFKGSPFKLERIAV